MNDKSKYLKELTESILQNPDSFSPKEQISFCNEVVEALNKGQIRAAEPDGNGNWKVNLWVKQAILLLFKFGKLADMSDGSMSFFDKDTIPMRKFSLDDKIRIVPGGSSIRTGAYLAEGVICMPPMYINIGAYIDSGTMVDSHALVGTCAQIGKNVHISAASQIGGVLEPAGAGPVIVEDNVVIGGNCGVYEGVIVRKNAVLATGVILNASTKIFDTVNNRIIKSENGKLPEVPENAVVVPGSRKIEGDFADQYGLAISTPIIIKYRNEKTNAKTALEEALR